MTDIDRVKELTRENDVPFFTDADASIQFYIDENGGDVDAAIYQILILKSENTSLSAPGLSSADTSSYFKRLARGYRPNNSGTLG